MDEDQLQAYQLALSGHNLLILGQAETGKNIFDDKNRQKFETQR
jgi:hypothetical protein